MTTDDEGEFSFRGQPYGTYWLEARAAVETENLRSATVEAILSKASPSAPTRLVVRRVKQLRGTVLSAVGGVPGAKISAVLPRTAGPSPMIVPETRTASDGRFTLELSTEVARLDLLVMAPGFVFGRVPVALAEDAELDVSVTQEGGGTLTINLKKPLSSFEFQERKPFVVMSDGFELDLGTLSLWASMNGAHAADGAFSVPLFPSDAYTVCWPVEGSRSETSCKSGFLPTGGSLVMTNEMTRCQITTKSPRE